MSQSPDLVMIALGTEGGLPRWFGPPLEPGIHVRWLFQPELGFPANGFTLFRRPHRPGTLVAIDAEPRAREVVFPQLVRRVEVRFTRPGFPAAVPPLPGIVGLLSGVPMAQADATVRATRVIAEIHSDAVDTVRIDARRGWRIDRVRYVPVDQDDTGWQRLARLCLPLRAPTYPCRRAAADPAADWTDAAARIPSDVTAYYLGAQTAPGLRWQQLHAVLDDMVRPFIPKITRMAAAGDDVPNALVGIPELLLLASIDPYLARVLGLYFVDGAAVPGQRYDYKIDGDWLKSQIAAPETTVTFESSFEKRPFSDTFLREGVIFRCANRPLVQRQDDAPWGDTRFILDLQPFTVDASGPPCLRIQLTAPAAEIQLYLRVFAGIPEAVVPDMNVNRARWTSADGGFVILSLAARTPADRIDAVILRPAGTATALHVGIAKVGTRTAWLAPLGDTRSWTCYRAEAGPSPPLAAVAGVTAAPLATPARELPNGGIASGPRAALGWTLPLAENVIAPRQPIRFLLQRQTLGNGTAPAVVDPALWETIRRTDNPALPVTVGTSGDGPPYLYADDPAFAAGKLQPDRFYAYRAAPIDLFGRLGPFGSPAIADLTDVDPPPPPSEVEAEILDAMAAIRIRWAWPAAKRTQAPDAREFRVYFHPGSLNALTGRVTSVAPNADGSFTVMTDCELPTTAANALAGEWLQLGGTTFPIVSNTTGPAVSAVVRAPSTPPPALPATGAFTVTLRAPRPLEGLVSRARPHLNGRVTLRTDQVTALPPNALANKLLRQAGRDSRILESSSGPLRLVVSGEGRVSRSAAVGRFAIVEPASAGSTPSPVLADAGNPLWVDFRKAARWAERLATVPISAADRYEIVVPYDLTVSTEKPIAGVSIAVSAADDKDYRPDDPRWNGTPLGDRRGNEGSLSAPILVQRAIAQPPLRPPAPDVGDGTATAADYLGNSYIDVRWMRVPGTRVQIFRSLDETLFSVDRKLRAGRASDRASYHQLSDAEFSQLVAAEPDYSDLSDELLTALARLPGNEAAFGLMTSEPIDGDSSRVVLAGRSSNRHLFAVRLVDAAGNRSELSWPSRTVQAQRMLPPRAPVIVQIASGNQHIKIAWVSTREAALAEFRVFRAASDHEARDIRSMTLIRTEAVPPGTPVSTPMAMEFTDADVPALTTFWYCVVAVDTLGNVSRPSSVLTGRAYDETAPVPPVPSVEWAPAPDGVVHGAIAWQGVDETLLQRRVESGPWLSITQWLEPGNHSYMDDAVDPTISCEYRVFARHVQGTFAIGAAVPLAAQG